MATTKCIFTREYDTHTQFGPFEATANKHEFKIKINSSKEFIISMWLFQLDFYWCHFVRIIYHMARFDSVSVLVLISISCLCHRFGELCKQDCKIPIEMKTIFEILSLRYAMLSALFIEYFKWKHRAQRAHLNSSPIYKSRAARLNADEIHKRERIKMQSSNRWTIKMIFGIFLGWACSFGHEFRCCCCCCVLRPSLIQCAFVRITNRPYVWPYAVFRFSNGCHFILNLKFNSSCEYVVLASLALGERNSDKVTKTKSIDFCMLFICGVRCDSGKGGFTSHRTFRTIAHVQSHINQSTGQSYKWFFSINWLAKTKDTNSSN